MKYIYSKNKNTGPGPVSTTSYKLSSASVSRVVEF